MNLAVGRIVITIFIDVIASASQDSFVHRCKVSEIKGKHTQLSGVDTLNASGKQRTDNLAVAREDSIDTIHTFVSLPTEIIVVIISATVTAEDLVTSTDESFPASLTMSLCFHTDLPLN
jgi:hypothetical protein